MRFFILGGGSNILISDKGFDGLVIKMEIKGREFKDELLIVGAGENWDEVVVAAVERGLGGIENLSLIPGTDGAAVCQNIGAYGVELKNVFHELDALNVLTQKKVTFDPIACEFSYRDSIFKKVKDTYIITHVTLRLNKKPQIILDPGLGHFVSAVPKYSFEIIARLHELTYLGYQILIGISRKSFLGGEIDSRDERGLPIQVIAALNGARILRTHEVKKLYDLLQTIS